MHPSRLLAKPHLPARSAKSGTVLDGDENRPGNQNPAALAQNVALLGASGTSRPAMLCQQLSEIFQPGSPILPEETLLSRTQQQQRLQATSSPQKPILAAIAFFHLSQEDHNSTRWYV